MSHKLFITVLQDVFQKLDQSKKGLKIDQVHLTHLKRKIRFGWCAFGKPSYILKGKGIPNSLKAKVYNHVSCRILRAVWKFVLSMKPIYKDWHEYRELSNYWNKTNDNEIQSKAYSGMETGTSEVWDVLNQNDGMIQKGLQIPNG